jgi:choline dehydrogenase-like flavoprotein
MVIDGRSIRSGDVLQADVCLVGAGAAGITLARCFDGAPFSVCLVESGGLAPDAATQDLAAGEYEGTVAIPDHLLGSRLRCFGGTTGHWTGWCRPLSGIDFEERAWVPNSGWPISKRTVDPYYDRAASVLEIRPFDNDLREVVTPDRPLLLADSGKVVTQIFHRSPPTRFGNRYRDELVRSRNVRVCLFSNLLELEVDEDAATVTCARVGGLDGNRFRVEAKHFVLAAGAIENSRLLLLSNRVERNGLGNRHDVVGRYYMEHPHLRAGAVTLTDPRINATLYYAHRNERFGHDVAGAFSIAEQVQRDEHLMNFRVYFGPTADSGEEAAFRKTVGSALMRLRALEAGTDGAEQAPQHFRLGVASEQAPDPSNRVTLSEERDALGSRRSKLVWHLSELDSRTVRKSVEILGRELGSRAMGRVSLLIDERHPWPAVMGGGPHQLGGTRMHVDPKKGVVDANCQVHGISNLHVAGGSVFPTGGFANPTLTIVALALRLADRIRRLLGAPMWGEP